MHLRKTLDSIESLCEAVQGYEHLPAEVLYRLLLENYTIDLDVLAEFTARLDEFSETLPEETYVLKHPSQSAA